MLGKAGGRCWADKILLMGGRGAATDVLPEASRRSVANQTRWLDTVRERCLAVALRSSLPGLSGVSYSLCTVHRVRAQPRCVVTRNGQVTRAVADEGGVDAAKREQVNRNTGAFHAFLHLGCLTQSCNQHGVRSACQ